MWIARDFRGLLFIYDKKPIKQDGFWVSDGSFGCLANDLFFPEVKWSDPEPRELVLKPIKEEQL